MIYRDFNNNYSLIKCECPIVIANKKAKQFLLQGFDCILLDGEIRKITYEERDYILKNGSYYNPVPYKYNIREEYRGYGFPSVVFLHEKEDITKEIQSKYANKISFNKFYTPVYRETYETYFNSMYYRSLDGATEPIYQIVKCNHCALCQDGKKQHWTFRTILEHYKNIEDGKSSAFITLTFRDDELLSYNELQYREEQVKIIQKFIKRLRSYLYRHGYDFKFKYIAVTEFGENTGRFHIHALLFGIPKELLSIENRVENKHYGENNDLRRTIPLFQDIIYNAWQKGFVYVEECDNEKASLYVTKYLGKDFGVEKYGNIRTVFLKSQKIGYEALSEYRQNILDSKEQATFPVMLGNNSFDIPYYRYIIDKIFPSVTTSLSKEFRDAFEKITMAVYNNYYHYSHPDVLFNYKSSGLSDIIYEEFIYKYKNLLNLFDYQYNNVVFRHSYLNSEVYDDEEVIKMLNDFEKEYTYDEEFVVMSAKNNEEHIKSLIFSDTFYDIPLEVMKHNKRQQHYKDYSNDNN